MYNRTARASGGNEDHMAGYFPLVKGKEPLLWLDNLRVECITSLQIYPDFSRPTTKRPTTDLVTVITLPECG
jgi:hypothetical protein